MSSYPDQAANDGLATSSYGPAQPRRKFVLCFDGTGNKFQGNSGDSNILKIYSMLDRTDGTQFHYYQPGIGTYTTSKSLSSDSMASRVASWYNKARDSAVGSTLDEHVMAGYKFLMRYYQTGDDIYFFGFSRGAYIARFLAEMLDHVGLLSSGNEELVRFVWKTFAKWQTRQGDKTEKEKKEKAEMLHFMMSFRETFSRPVRRIRFLGVFDTVNSVSKFETAWMERSKRFPYTARSSAIVIRHAVAIDERRAKFRQDLISQKKECVSTPRRHHHLRDIMRNHRGNGVALHDKYTNESKEKSNTGRFSPSKSKYLLSIPGEGSQSFRYRSRSRGRSRGSNARPVSRDKRDGRSITQPSLEQSSGSADDRQCDTDDEDENLQQDIEEVWFPGGHADIGGGWPPDEPEKLALSHGPLVWMVHEAQRAGLIFLPEKLKELKCYFDDIDPDAQTANVLTALPELELNDQVIATESSEDKNKTTTPATDQDRETFLSTLESSCTRAHIHDSLCLSCGSGMTSVLAWRIMEYLPFKRMDLRPDGSWKAIRWPLPMGEVRDVPNDVKIHNSVIRRMRFDPEYRPGNLIMGGGGRGRRKAPPELGMGEWMVLREEGHPVGEVWVKRKKSEMREKGEESGLSSGRE